MTRAIDARDRQSAIDADKAAKAAQGALEELNLASFVRHEFDVMNRHRDNTTAGWSHRLAAALRAFNGVYDPGKLASIKEFGGSEIYSRIISTKCRGASSLLRDVYLGSDRPWGLEPPDDPTIPQEVLQSIAQLVAAEANTMQQMGTPVEENKIRDRVMQLTEAARQAAKKRGAKQAKVSEDKIDEILKLGGFYKALAQFITDLPLFPFACIKGPVVRIQPEVTWQGNQATIKQTPRLTWSRISPFDVWWTPGVADIEDANVIERVRFTRADLNDMLDLPGYNKDAVLAVLDEYGRGGLTDFIDGLESERADQESRENPHMNTSGLITGVEFNGNVQGRLLLQEGLTSKQIPDPLRDYYVQAWIIGRYTVKVQLSPSPRKRHPYFMTSFEKVPGTPVGNGLPDILEDISDAANATLRALINNMSIASGPQVVINTDRLAGGEDPEDLHPWKRWLVTQDPLSGRGSGSEKPVDFFQPESNAQELLGVYQKFVDMADEASAIPKYLQGSGTTGGAGRTASGLAMLMGNASKILQTVAANIDGDVLTPCLDGLYDMVMLTDDSGLLTGSETIRVLGVAVATQRETMRSRQLEFLQMTANPIDLQIMGPNGRAKVLRAVSNGIGLDGEDIVPSEDDLEAQQAKAAAIGEQQGIPGHGGVGEGAADAQGAQPTPLNQQQGPQTNNVQTRTQPRVAGGVG